MFFDIVNIANSLLSKVLSKRGTRIEKKILAVKLMQRAINNTKHYLNTSEKLKSNTELSNLWNDAFGAMFPINKVLARKLYNNSRFWSNPDEWLLEKGSMELIPTLKELEERCESILIELENRL